MRVIVLFKSLGLLKGSISLLRYLFYSLKVYKNRNRNGFRKMFIDLLSAILGWREDVSTFSLIAFNLNRVWISSIFLLNLTQNLALQTTFQLEKFLQFFQCVKTCIWCLWRVQNWSLNIKSQKLFPCSSVSRLEMMRL